MKTIFIVTAGVYSDYSIYSVHTTREKAEAWIEFEHDNPHFSEEYNIEEWELDPDPPEYVDVIDLMMSKYGDTINVEKNVRSLNDCGFCGYSTLYHDFKNFKRGDTLLRWIVYTDSVERAVKVVNEKRAILIANEAWNDMAKTMELLK